jgi:LmbE family N-acetylglucosaminyl deacetylase
VIGLLPDQPQLRVLCLGAHPDDIEIGCGATLLGLAQRAGTTVRAVVLTGSELRAGETRRAMDAFCPGSEVDILGFPDGRLPAHWNAVKDALESTAVDFAPEVIFAPRPHDAHQDHRLVGQLVTTVWRNALVLHYEIPKWDPDPVAPNVYVAVSAARAARKVDLLDEHFGSQRGRDWWDRELFVGLLRQRGVECRHRYAEAFTVPKAVIDLSGLEVSGEEQ